MYFSKIKCICILLSIGIVCCICPIKLNTLFLQNIRLLHLSTLHAHAIYIQPWNMPLQHYSTKIPIIATWPFIYLFSLLTNNIRFPPQVVLMKLNVHVIENWLLLFILNVIVSLYLYLLLKLIIHFSRK